MYEPAPPPLSGRLAGREFGRCPARQRRKKDRHALEQYVRDELGTAPCDPLVDESDCRHGCNGHCLASGSERCDFTCHPSWQEMFPNRPQPLRILEGTANAQA
jgi:hypothetical protein